MFPDVYKQFFRCYPVTQLDASESKKRSGNFGGKIYLPPSALNKLTTMRISYPMLFEIKANKSGNKTHAGVLEFIAPEGRVYLPEWMMATLNVGSGSLVHIQSVTLELGKFVKIEPQSVDFLEISDPKAVLEHTLTNFSALTTNDIFQIDYNDKVYSIKVLEVQPETDKSSICVVETDLEVDFAPPVGYEEPTDSQKKQKLGTRANQFDASSGAPLTTTNTQKLYNDVVKSTKHGFTLSGKKVDLNTLSVDKSIYTQRDAPALDLPLGQLFFGFPVVPFEDEEETEKTTEPEIKGEGRSLR